MISHSSFSLYRIFGKDFILWYFNFRYSKDGINLGLIRKKYTRHPNDQLKDTQIKKVQTSLLRFIVLRVHIKGTLMQI